MIIPTVLVDYEVKFRESAKRDQHWDPARELRKLYNMRVTVTSIVNGVLRAVPKSLKGAKRGERRRTSRYLPNYGIFQEISQNTEKRHVDLSRLAVTQIPVKSHHR